jgi:hypothetical protein
MARGAGSLENFFTIRRLLTGRRLRMSLRVKEGGKTSGDNEHRGGEAPG